jgi:hypothetical protein
MIRFPQTGLIVLLVLLQMVAPLVHAHSGIDRSPEGVHVPGLEVFDTDEESQARSTARYELYGQTGIIVGIASGLKDRPTVPQFDPVAAPLGRLSEPPGPRVSPAEERPLPPPHYRTSFYHSSAPRAPPRSALT